MKYLSSDLNNVVARNDNDSQMISLAQARIADTKMSERAINLLVAFAFTITKSDVNEYDPQIANMNVYAIEKASKTIQAMSMNAASMLDKYTLSIVSAMKARATKRLSNAEQNAVLAASIACESLRATDKRLHKAASTATTQSSSTRVMLQALKIARDDNKALVLIESENNSQFMKLFEKKKK